MLTYSFANIGSDSLYEHLYKCIKKDILSKNISVGDKLPSKRSLSKNLGISVITVENAYAQLISEGYIYSIPKKGFYVADITAISRIPEIITPADSIISIETISRKKIDMISNHTSLDNFPFSIWAKLMREVLSSNQPELMINSPCGGILKLRNAIARHLRDYRDIHVEPIQIIVGAGTEYLYSLLVQLLGFDKIYAIEEPGYQKIAQVYTSHHVICKHIPIDNQGISISELEASNSDVLHLSPSHHFPSGIITPISRRYELLGWASKKEGRYIIEDDYDSEFRMVGKPIPSMQNIDLSEKVIYMNTFNKSLSSTIRISYMVLPMHLINKFYKDLSFYSCTVSNFEQYTLARFIDEGYFEKHINRMRSYYHTKRDNLISKITSSRLNKYTTILEEDSGLHFILDIKTDMKDDEFCELALRSGLKIASISDFYAEPSSKNTHRFIVNYSSISEEDTERVIDILSAMIFRK
ncbi:MAG: PLP-dependent aminotransferase family protein [Lachnospiraceae bacterium]|nr:PLP-dependent aminotransferase family protein [Lachnospiraceae bacterium]